MSTPRLDILIYAHDGRGMGHVSRSIAIGLALRRLYPRLKVLFLSGSSFAHELIGPHPLDWLKLPAYATTVVAGSAKGIAGTSNYSDKELGLLRSKAIHDAVAIYQPRVLLCDHSPQGKHKELLPALDLCREIGTQVFLGVRGIVGGVPQLNSELARTVFREYYQDLFWYGDQVILGEDQLQALEEQFAIRPKECGYVSRFQEWMHDTSAEKKRLLAGTVSIPWNGTHTLEIMSIVAKVLKAIGGEYGEWRLFIQPGSTNCQNTMKNLFSTLPHCRLEPPGSRFFPALQQSKTALIYGGYNSITDVLASQTPAVVMQRLMQDQEQFAHCRLLDSHLEGRLLFTGETSIDATSLQALLLQQLHADPGWPAPVNLQGAVQTSHYLAAAINQTAGR